MIAAAVSLVVGFTGRTLPVPRTRTRATIPPKACDDEDGLSPWELARADGLATIRFSLDGGHVTSWVCGGEEQLFLSDEANFIEGQMAIRGGVPICWPAFSERNPKAGKHGIVRASESWDIVEAGTEPDEFMVLEHEMVYLEVDPTSSAIVDYYYDEPVAAQVTEAVVVPATLRLRVEVLPSSLRMEMQVINGGGTPFTFSTVFHTYYQVHTMPVTIRGFRGKSGRKDGEPFTDEAAEVVVDGRLETQRLYQDVDGAVSWVTQSANVRSRSQDRWTPAPLHPVDPWTPAASWETQSANVR